MQTLFLPQLLALGLSLGAPNPQAIVGGITVEPVDPIAASTVLILQADKSLGQAVYYCSGSLISQDLVITAAHCVHESGRGKGPALPPERLLIYPENLSSPKNFDPGKVLRISAAISHPLYTDRLELINDLHDVALLRLTDPAPAGLRAADILPIDRKIRKNEKVTVAGYGFTKKDQLQTAEFILHKFTDYVFRRFDHDLAELKGPRNLGSFHGDSGGPAFLEENGAFRLWGVLSCVTFARGRAFYADLRNEKDWLEQAAVEMGTSLRLP